MISKIKLKNWKAHSDSEFSFSKGINVLVGSMGSGKSSVLQALSFALFGTFLDIKRKDITQAELIKRGSDERFAQVEAEFSCSDESYTIQRKISEKGANEAIVRDSNGLLAAGPNPTSANQFVKDKLKADEDVFFRTVYCVQNEIDFMLRLSPKERKEKIDELMGLKKFDNARNNCTKLRNNFSKTKADYEKIISGINLESLKKELSDAISEMSSVKEAHERMKKNYSVLEAREIEAIKKNDSLRTKAEEIHKKSERKVFFEEEILLIKEQTREQFVGKSKQELENEIEGIKKRIEASKQFSEKKESEKEEIRNQLLRIEREKIGSESELKEKKSKLEAIRKVKQKIVDFNIKDIHSELEEIKSSRKALEKEFNALNAEISSEREHLAELEKADSLCPVCSSELSEQSKEELISAKRKKLSEWVQKNQERKQMLSSLEEKEKVLENIFIENRAALGELSDEENIKQSAIEIEAKIRAFSSDKEMLSEKARAISEDELKARNEINFLLSEKERLESFIKIVELNLKKDELLKKLAEVVSFLESSKSVIEEMKASELEKNESIKSVQEAKTKIDGYSGLITEKEFRIKSLEREINQVNEYFSEVKKTENKIQFIEKLKTAIEIAQKNLRDQLILAVNEMMESIWTDLYPYDKWQSVRLFVGESDYVLELKSIEGDWLRASGFASGGEKMIASLAVRIAFSRILAPGLGLLILDEPTHNLDSKAVETLVELIKDKLGELIEQVFVVTHDERLAEAGNNVLRL